MQKNTITVYLLLLFSSARRASLCLALPYLLAAGLHAATLPNIVVFISDDLGRLDTSIHGSKDVRTPTMDRLAVGGMTFDNAYVASPACCPSRFSLLTGLMPARHGAHPNHSQVKPGTKFLPPILKKLGYHIASFGKVAHRNTSFAGLDFNSPEKTNMSKEVVKHFSKTQIDGPICLLVGDRRPHVEWTKQMNYDPKHVTLPPFFIDTQETREHWARYLTDIEGMDEEMSRVLEFAKEKFGDNFIFIFTSDHGGQWPFGKWNLYDYGTRVPLVAYWPGHIEAGVRTDAMVSWVDLLPTLIDIAGGKYPAEIDGKSFAPVLLGKTKTHRDKIFTTNTGDKNMNIYPIRSVRIGKYKFIHNLRPDAYHSNHSDILRNDGRGLYWDSWDEAAKTDPKAAAIIKRYYTRPEFELFDLDKDPLELDNLADNPEYKVELAKLKSELSTWTTAQGDDLLPHRDPYLRSGPRPTAKLQKEKSKKKSK
jgi:N-sulfoglucosamine sulfohydrolase